MSYIRHGHELLWFNDTSTEYVYGCGTGIEDYNTGYNHLPSLVELVGNIVMAETKDFDYATKIVVHLARGLKIDNKLRSDKFCKNWVDTLMMRSGRDYEKCIQKYLKQTEPVVIPHLPDDDISDFDYLTTYCDEDLFDVEKHMGRILEDIESVVKKITSEITMPPVFNVETAHYRWESLCGEDYEIGAVVKLDENSDMSDEKIDEIETTIKNHPMFKALESKYGELSMMVYIPFDINSIGDSVKSE